MITNISIASVFVKDVDESKRFYVDVLGFAEKDDITLGDGYRWCTVAPQPARARGPPHGAGSPTLARDGRRHQPRPRRGRHARPGSECRRLPQDLRGARRQGRGVHPATGGASVRRRGADAGQLRQLDGAGRAARLLRRGLRPGRRRLTRLFRSCRRRLRPVSGRRSGRARQGLRNRLCGRDASLTVGDMWVALLRVVLATAVVALALVALLHALFGWRPWRRPIVAARGWAERRRPTRPETRPIEELAVAARRLGGR